MREGHIEVELRGPDPGWIETLFYHLRTLMVENAFSGVPNQANNKTKTKTPTLQLRDPGHQLGENTSRPRPKKCAYFGPYSTPEKYGKHVFNSPGWKQTLRAKPVGQRLFSLDEAACSDFRYPVPFFQKKNAGQNSTRIFRFPIRAFWGGYHRRGNSKRKLY